jgi:hypothetical protein
MNELCNATSKINSVLKIIDKHMEQLHSQSRVGKPSLKPKLVKEIANQRTNTELNLQT